MDAKEQRSALRAAVYRGDGPAVVELLRGVGADADSLQLAGDGVVAAVMQRVDGAAELAREFVVALRQRGWDGDDELADQLEAQLGSGPAAMLRALPVDLEELAGILEGDPVSVGGRIDIRTGEVWTPLMIASGGWRSTARAHARATGTWSCSSRPSRTRAGPSVWRSRSEAAARFAASRTSLPAGPASLSDGTLSPRSASAAARDHGSRRPATACCRSTAAIPEDGPSACYRPERGTISGLRKGRQTHARA
jgi:hypothetical protein